MGKSRKVGEGSGSWTRENEILKNFMLQGSQSTGKYATPERSYILKCTNYLVPLAYMPSPIHAILVIITGWHNQPHFNLLPTPRPQASFPSPPHYYLARLWCSGARKAMNLVLPKIKDQRKDQPRGLGKETSPAGRLG